MPAAAPCWPPAARTRPRTGRREADIRRGSRLILAAANRTDPVRHPAGQQRRSGAQKPLHIGLDTQCAADSKRRFGLQTARRFVVYTRDRNSLRKHPSTYQIAGVLSTVSFDERASRQSSRAEHRPFPPFPRARSDSDTTAALSLMG